LTATTKGERSEAAGTTRRRFLLGLTGLGTAVGVGGLVHGLTQTSAFDIVTTRLAVPGLAADLDGFTLAWLTDLHHRVYVRPSYFRRVMAATHELAPDVILLGGDYAYGDQRFIDALFAILADLHAPHGVYGVLGNHDHWLDATRTRTQMRRAGIAELRNRHVVLRGRGTDARAARPGEPGLVVAGVGDLWEDEVDVDAALDGAPPVAPTILLSHNPDLAEDLPRDDITLMLAGHTHGGQVQLPGYGPPVVPSRYGQKYAAGLVQGPRCPVYISRGLGEVFPPVRFGCPPELSVIALRITTKPTPAAAGCRARRRA